MERVRASRDGRGFVASDSSSTAAYPFASSSLVPAPTPPGAFRATSGVRAGGSESDDARRRAAGASPPWAYRSGVTESEYDNPNEDEDDDEFVAGSCYSSDYPDDEDDSDVSYNTQRSAAARRSRDAVALAASSASAVSEPLLHATRSRTGTLAPRAGRDGAGAMRRGSSSQPTADVMAAAPPPVPSHSASTATNAASAAASTTSKYGRWNDVMLGVALDTLHQHPTDTCPKLYADFVAAVRKMLPDAKTPTAGTFRNKMSALKTAAKQMYVIHLTRQSSTVRGMVETQTSDEELDDDLQRQQVALLAACHLKDSAAKLDQMRRIGKLLLVNATTNELADIARCLGVNPDAVVSLRAERPAAAAAPRSRSASAGAPRTCVPKRGGPMPSIAATLSLMENAGARRGAVAEERVGDENRDVNARGAAGASKTVAGTDKRGRLVNTEALAAYSSDAAAAHDDAIVDAIRRGQQEQTKLTLQMLMQQQQQQTQALAQAFTGALSDLAAAMRGQAPARSQGGQGNR